MYGEKGSSQKKKTLHHWIVLQISHLVAISCGAMLLGEMLAEVTDDFRVKAGWRSDFTQQRRKTGLYFWSFSLCPFFLSAFLPFLHLCICLHAYPIHLSRMISKIMRVYVSWRKFLSFCLIFQKSNLHPNVLEPRVRKWKLSFVWARLYDSWNNYGKDIREGRL